MLTPLEKELLNALKALMLVNRQQDTDGVMPADKALAYGKAEATIAKAEAASMEPRATDFLSALKATRHALAQWVEIADDHDRRVADEDALDAADAAIALAEGSPPEGAAVTTPSPDDDFLEAMAEVLRISDRDHIAWHNARAKLDIAKARRRS